MGQTLDLPPIFILIMTTIIQRAGWEAYEALVGNYLGALLVAIVAYLMSQVLLLASLCLSNVCLFSHLFIQILMLYLHSPNISGWFIEH